MRALTMEELDFVSGGEEPTVETIVVTGTLTPSDDSTGGAGVGPFFTAFNPNKPSYSVDVSLELNLDLNKLANDLDDSNTSVAEKGAQLLQQMQTLGQASINKGNTNSWSVVGTLNGVKYAVTGQGGTITGVSRSTRGGTMIWQSSWGAPGGGFWRPQ